jgi:hypothetical protein
LLFDGALNDVTSISSDAEAALEVEAIPGIYSLFFQIYLSDWQHHLEVSLFLTG